MKDPFYTQVTRDETSSAKACEPEHWKFYEFTNWKMKEKKLGIRETRMQFKFLKIFDNRL